MKTRRTKLEKLTTHQIERITAEAEKNKKIPLITSRQVNMRLDDQTLDRIKKLADLQGIPYTTFLTRLLKEDVKRLWEVFKNQ